MTLVFHLCSKGWFSSILSGNYKNVWRNQLMHLILTSYHIKVHILKATKFCEIFTLLLTVCTVVKSKVKISQNFVAFSEYMNFKYKILRNVTNQCVEDNDLTGFWVQNKQKDILGAFFSPHHSQPASQFTVHSTVPPGLTTICGAIKSDTSHKLHPAVSNRGAGIGNPAKSFSGPGIP